MLAAELAETRGDFERQMRLSAIAFAGVLTLVVVVVVPLTLANSVSITRPMTHAREVALAIAEGDLTVTVVAKKRWIPFLNNADCAVFDMDAALISCGTADGWKEHRQYDMATSEEAEFESELADLVTREFNLAGQTEMWQPAGRF